MSCDVCVGSCESLTCERILSRRTEHSQSSDSSSVDRCSRAREETEAGYRKVVLGKDEMRPSEVARNIEEAEVVRMRYPSANV